MGSEGLFGIITEAVIKVTCLPEKKVFDSIIFPNFEKGYKFMRETAAQKHWPASLRLIDNT
jgi:alkyldihydroxyacetonephosphate synthase